jgi:hypothetical protein
MMKVLYRARCAMFVLLCFGSAAGAPATVRGVIRDPSGAVLARAAIQIQHWHVEGGQARRALNEPLTYADMRGVFTTRLTPGFYCFLITYPGFSPVAKELEVKSSAQVSLEFELPFSPLAKFIR